MPELAPTLPSDTLQATQPIDSFPCNPFGGDSVDSVPADTLEAADPCGSLPTDPFGDDRTAPQTPGDSAALRDLRSWIERHPGLISPPPVRAVLVRV